MNEAEKDAPGPADMEKLIQEMYGDRIAQWARLHPGKRLPIVIVDGVPRWLTRKQRLTIASRTRKEHA